MELPQDGNAISGARHGVSTRQIAGTLLADKLHIEIQDGSITKSRGPRYDAIVQELDFPRCTIKIGSRARWSESRETFPPRLPLFIAEA